MADFLVTSTADSGTGSLREALGLALSNAPSSLPDRILFDPSLIGAEIMLTSGELALLPGTVASGGVDGGRLEIVGDVNGDGTADITLDGSDNTGWSSDGLMVIHAGVDVAIDGLIFQNGSDNDGGTATLAGALMNFGTAEVSNSVFRNNESEGTWTWLYYFASAYRAAGAVYNAGTLSLSNTVFSGNTAHGTYGLNTGMAAGALVNRGDLNLQGVTFTGNTGVGGNGLAGGYYEFWYAAGIGGMGVGAVANLAAGTLTAVGSVYDANVGTGGFGAGNRFAEYNINARNPDLGRPGGDAVGGLFNAGTATLTGATFTSGTAQAGTGYTLYYRGSPYEGVMGDAAGAVLNRGDLTGTLAVALPGLSVSNAPGSTADGLPGGLNPAIVGDTAGVSLTLAGGVITHQGGATRDMLPGTGQQDVIDGGGDHDTISGFGGNDTLLGNPGDDRIFGGGGADLILGGAGNDRILSEAGSDSAWGMAGDDVLTGGNHDDLLDGGDGLDHLRGQGGNDTLMGGAGNDFLSGGGADDVMFGGTGNDLITAQWGRDLLWGGTGNDTLSGGSGADALYGGKGDDVLNGQDNNDVLKGGLGDDRVFGGFGFDVLYGGNGDDSLYGGNAADTIYAGGGQDRIAGGAGDDSFVFHFLSPSQIVRATILGFEDDADTLVLDTRFPYGDYFEPSDFPVAALLQDYATQVDPNTVVLDFSSPRLISWGYSHHITIQSGNGITISDLADDILMI